MKTCLIIGGGAAGIAAAHQLTLMGEWDITLVEQAPFLGAGIRTFFHGGHPYTFGPRHLLFHNELHYHYLNRIVPLRNLRGHEFWTYVSDDSNFYNFPIHTADIGRMPEAREISLEILARETEIVEPKNLEEYWIYSVGKTLYKKFVEKYSQKMWGIPANELDTFNWSPKGVALKSGPRAAWDTAMSCYPYGRDGYNPWFEKATAGAKVLLNTQLKRVDLRRNYAIFPDESRHDYDIIICTISPDIPFGRCYGELPYIGRDFHKIVLPVEYALPKDVFWIYEAGNEVWTRCTEFKKMTGYKSPHTLLGLEIPSANGRHYPLPLKKWQQVAEHYYGEMSPGVFCMGRNGSYRYSIDIAACIEQAHELVEVLKQGGQDHAVVGAKWRN